MSGQAALIAVFTRFNASQRTAAVLDGQTLTFDRLYHRALRLAIRLRAQGDGPVVIYGHKQLTYLTAIWACIIAGRTFIPTESDNSTERLQQIIAGAQATLLLNLTTTPTASLTAGAWLSAVEADDAAPTPTLTAALREVAPCQSAYIMFSSGTTGLPKGIGVSYANVADFLGWIGRDFPLSGAVSGNIRYCFDVSLYELWLSWLFLQPLVVLDHQHFFNTRLALQAHAAQATACWVSTPTITRFYLNDKQFNARTLPALRHFLFCGEVLSKELVSALWQRFPGARITNTYGPTECTVAVTTIDIQPHHLSEAALPLGRARPGTRLALATPNVSRGELLISGASVGVGYLNASPAQQARFFVNPRGENSYRTGDIVSLKAGVLYFQGRADREIKLQGYRLDLNEIEQVLQSLPQVRDAFVETWSRQGHLQGIAAFVLGTDGEPDFALLSKLMAQRVPIWMVPKRWY
ncbi:MAG: AMP-binding protein, partial [Pantoea sp.]|nr:AMP-binding protein [Pantoea sp.]